MPTPLPRRSCALSECGRTFSPPHPLSRYCSPECAKKAQKDQLRAIGKKRKALNAPVHTLRPCAGCGGEFAPLSTRQHYCSRLECLAASAIASAARRKERREKARQDSR